MSTPSEVLSHAQLDQLYHDLGGADACDVLDEIITSFTDSSHEHIDALSALAQQDSLVDTQWRDIVYHAHTLKGMALHMGARALADAAAWIEKNSQSPSNDFDQQFKQLAPLLPKLQAQSLEAIHQWRASLKCAPA